MLRSFVCMTLMNFVLVIGPRLGYTKSPSDLVSQGNKDYLAGEYDKALSAYDEASVDAPESPYIYFNKGAALYQKGDYAAATEAFEKAALKSKDPRLEAKSKFNLGNCAYREAERQQDSDLNKALEACAKSIQYYQEALVLDPGFTEAAENIEMVRLVMKNILDTLKKQQEAAQQQQEAMERTVEQLKELIKRQQEALDRNQHLEDERRMKGDSPKLREQVQDLAGDQKDLQAETEDLAENMPKPAGQTPSPEESLAKKHLKNAAKEQNAAAGNLEHYHTSEAKTNQEKALVELKDALSSLSEDQKGRGGQKEQRAQGDQQQPQQQGVPPEQGPQDKENQQGDQMAVAQLSEDAHDILDEEKENKKQRRVQAAGGYRDVDKDW